VAQHRALNRLRAVLTSKPSAEVTERVNAKTPTGRIGDHLGSFTEWTADGRAVW
ncbi:MAG: hypothetical protein QOG46_506, partial [Pseudonocardiales bacterium]|nr:hypothetical protein [Pseudonocardiales bacterium]